MKKYFGVVKTAGKDFMADSAPRLGASVAFYTIFSLSPLLLIILAIAQFYFHSADAARHQIVQQIAGLVGDKGADAIQSIISQPDSQRHGIIATVIAGFTLMLGSTAVFMELQQALNRIWEVEAKPGAGIWGFIKHRLLSFAMVLSIGFLLIVSLVLTAGVSAISKRMSPNLEVVGQILNFVLSFGVITLLFALIFKYMPDVRMPWRDIWVGAALTSLLFAVGKLGLGIYLAKSTTANAFGAAGSLVIVLLWVYYSSQIMFFGCEVTQALAKLRGSKVVPTKHAVVKAPEDQRKDAATEGAQGESKTKPQPKPMPRYQPAHAFNMKHSVVGPALVLLLALFLPRSSRSHAR
jgi:membrane protein